jgi:hypothetical protein
MGDDDIEEDPPAALWPDHPWESDDVVDGWGYGDDDAYCEEAPGQDRQERLVP